MVLFNSMPNSCSGTNSSCKNCQKKYNCLPYAINLLEGINNSSQSIITNIIENLENLNTIQKNSQQQLYKVFDDKMSTMEDKIKTELFNIVDTLKENVEVSKENDNNDMQDQSVEPMEAEVLSASNETSLVQSGQKILREKKGLFGKTKWVEE